MPGVLSRGVADRSLDEADLMKSSARSLEIPVDSKAYQVKLTLLVVKYNDANLAFGGLLTVLESVVDL